MQRLVVMYDTAHSVSLPSPGGESADGLWIRFFNLCCIGLKIEL